MKIKFGQFSKVVMALAMIAPVVTPVGSVLAVDGSERSDYYQRFSDGRVHTFPKIENGTINFNRPLYRNDNSNLSDDVVKTIANDGYSNPKWNTLNRSQFINDQQNFGGSLGTFNTDSKKFIHPQMELYYTYDQDPVGVKFKQYFPLYVLDGEFEVYDFGKLKNDASQSLEKSIELYKNDLQNALQDYNKGGTLQLQYKYSVYLDTPGWLPNLVDLVQNYGLGFNAYVRVPDGYDSDSVLLAGIKKQDVSKLILNPSYSSKAKVVLGQALQNRSFNVFSNDYSSRDYNPLQKVDDHLLKFSINKATNDGSGEEEYSKTIGKFINKNALRPSFVDVLKQDLPIQLKMVLDMDTLSKKGDAFDFYKNNLLTRGRKLPSIDNKSVINATFLSSDKLVKVKTKKGKYGYFPLIRASDASDINRKTSGFKKTGQVLVPNQYIPDVSQNNIPSGFPDNGHSIFQNASILDNESTITDRKGNFDSSKEFEPDYMNSGEGNAIETWNQYISLVDPEDKYNINNPNELAYKGKSKTTVSLPSVSDDPYRKQLTLYSSDLQNGKFDPMDFYRSINYFDREDTTAKTKKNVTFAETKDTNGKTPSRSSDNLVQLNPGETKQIHYYGTDENGHPFSPATLTVTRPKYEFSGESKIKLRDEDDSKFRNSVDVLSGDWVTQRDTYNFLDLNSIGAISAENFINIRLPEGATTEDGRLKYSVTVGGIKLPEETPAIKQADGSYQIQVSPLDTQAMVKKGRPVVVEYSYLVNGDANKALETKRNKIVGHIANSTEKTEGMIGNASTINIIEPTLSLVSVPTIVDFGVNPIPSEDHVYKTNKISYEGAKGIGLKYNAKDPNLSPSNWSLTMKIGGDLPGVVNFKKDKDGTDILKLNSSPQNILSNDDKALIKGGTDDVFYLFKDLDFTFDYTHGNQVSEKKYNSEITWNLSNGPTI